MINVWHITLASFCSRVDDLLQMLQLKITRGGRKNEEVKNIYSYHTIFINEEMDTLWLAKVGINVWDLCFRRVAQTK